MPGSSKDVWTMWLSEHIHKHPQLPLEKTHKNKTILHADYNMQSLFQACLTGMEIFCAQLLLSIETPIWSYNCWIVLNVTLNPVPTYYLLHSTCSDHSQLDKFWGLAHFKQPWAVSRFCASRAVSSVLTATAGRRDKCFKFPRAQRETMTGLKSVADFSELLAVYILLQSQHGKMNCMQEQDASSYLCSYHLAGSSM